MEEDLYDEFGNYIGPQIDVSDDAHSSEEGSMDGEAEHAVSGNIRV